MVRGPFRTAGILPASGVLLGARYFILTANRVGAENLHRLVSRCALSCLVGILFAPLPSLSSRGVCDEGSAFSFLNLPSFEFRPEASGFQFRLSHGRACPACSPKPRRRRERSRRIAGSRPLVSHHSFQPSLLDGLGLDNSLMLSTFPRANVPNSDIIHSPKPVESVTLFLCSSGLQI